MGVGVGGCVFVFVCVCGWVGGCVCACMCVYCYGLAIVEATGQRSPVKSPLLELAYHRVANKVNYGPMHAIWHIMLILVLFTPVAMVTWL